MPIHLNMGELGSVFTTDGEDLWELQAFCETPTVTLKNLRTQEQITAPIDSAEIRRMVRLVPQTNQR